MKNDVRFGAAYLRVSTEDQMELSPDSQLAEIRKYAKRENIVILSDQIYIDPGISGKKAEKRPAFMHMIATAKEKKCPFSVILVWKFSRFARNQEESIFYKSILRSKCNVEVVSVTEPLVPGPFGSLIERIIEWMDEFYSIRLSQEVKRSMTVNAKRGKLQCIASFGYKIENGKLVPIADEAKLVRWIFESFVNGKGLFPIAKELNALGARTHRGNPFENRGIEYILRNPVYIGKLRWNPAGRTRRDFFNENIITANGNHEPIVDEDLWNAAQKQLDAVKAQWGYKAKPTYNLKHWATGIVRCASCGSTLIFSAPHYFKCNNYVRGKCSTSQHTPVSVLASAIIDQLQQDTSSFHLSYNVTFSAEKGGQQIEYLETELRHLNQKKSRLQEAYLAGVLELDEFAGAKRELQESTEQTQKDLENARIKFSENEAMTILQKAIENALKTILSPSATEEEKNKAARSVIENCTYDKATATLSITYRLFI